MLLVDGERWGAVCHPAWCGVAGLGVAGSQRLGRDDGVRSGSVSLLHGWQPSRMLVPLPESPGHGRVCPPSKMAWAVQQELVVQSLFEGVSGHLRGVTEIILRIRAVPLPIPHCHMDGDGHLRP